MSDEEAELEALQGLIAQQLEPLGQVTLSVVCRTVYKVVVQHDTGVSVRVLICSDSYSGRPFVNIMPVLDPTERALCDDSRSFREIPPDGSMLDSVVQQVKATLDTAVSGLKPKARASSIGAVPRTG